LLPRPVLDAFRIARGRIRPVFSGVYRRYRDVPARGPGYDGPVWAERSRAQAQRELAELRAGVGTAAQLRGDRAVLPAIAADVERRRGEVAVVDFGGAEGFGYIDLRRALGPAARIRYDIVETPAVCAEGRRLFADDGAIRFHMSVEDVPAGADIVFISTALQYIEDYAALLRRLAGLGAEHLVLVKLAAGAIPTYATAQLNLPGSVLAHWLLSLDEVVALLRQEGYDLAARTPSDRRLVGFAVPKAYRIERAVNLVFRRRPGSAIVTA
jgi:putative methyltransferase (TIGR04325 family)